MLTVSFKGTLLLRVTEGNFMFNGEFYKQIDGLAMGGPLGPTLANFFLAHLEVSRFHKCPIGNQPKLYYRYVDDVFAIFDENQSYKDFFKFINKVHPNLEFTYELATTSLPFLDVNVCLNEYGVDLDVFRKKTDTNVLLNFSAVAPTKWKEGLVFCMLHRAWKVCNSTAIFSKEVCRLEKIFSDNGYPAAFFKKICEKFHKRLLDQPSDSDKDDNDDHIFLLVLPFIHNISKTFEKKLRSILLKKFDVKIKVVYKSCKLSSFFSLKDKTPLPLLSKVVYKFTCLRDVNLAYIGETTRPLQIRVDEHLSKKSTTAVGKHIKGCDVCKNGSLTLKDFEVLKRCSTNGETRIHEALLIRKESPQMNKQLHLSGASFILSVY